jgi:hypothetical protein
MKVVTTNGTVHTATKQDPNGGDERVPLSQEDAEAIAARCNKQAEALGIKTRYEVKDA